MTIQNTPTSLWGTTNGKCLIYVKEVQLHARKEHMITKEHLHPPLAYTGAACCWFNFAICFCPAI